MFARAMSSDLQANLGALDIKDADHLLALSALWDQLGLTKLINEVVPHDEQVLLSPGLGIKVLVLNATSGRDALYRVQTFFQRAPNELLFGPDINAQQLNDKAFGRTLDRIFEAGGEKLFSSIALSVIANEKLDISRVHADTTSKLLFGQYKHPDDDAISTVRPGTEGTRDHLWPQQGPPS